jgi:hypothetical protein
MGEPRTRVFDQRRRSSTSTELQVVEPRARAESASPEREPRARAQSASPEREPRARAQSSSGEDDSNRGLARTSWRALGATCNI